VGHKHARTHARTRARTIYEWLAVASGTIADHASCHRAASARTAPSSAPPPPCGSCDTYVGKVATQRNSGKSVRVGSSRCETIQCCKSDTTWREGRTIAATPAGVAAAAAGVGGSASASSPPPPPPPSATARPATSAWPLSAAPSSSTAVCVCVCVCVSSSRSSSRSSRCVCVCARGVHSPCRVVAVVGYHHLRCLVVGARRRRRVGGCGACAHAHSVVESGDAVTCVAKQGRLARWTPRVTRSRGKKNGSCENRRFSHFRVAKSTLIAPKRPCGAVSASQNRHHAKKLSKTLTHA
jgi:hypothetical protein